MVLTSEQLLEDLTEAQRAAAKHVDGPLLIIAGAGSGKTRVITRRVAHLISLGIPASSILAITFTNKAAGEMKQRVASVLGRPIYDFGRLEQRGSMICTFHSLCLRILRHYATVVGLPANFTIYDSSDQTKVIKDALKTLEISTTNFSPGTVHATISNAKNKLQSAEMFSQAAGDFYSKNIARIYSKYQQLLKTNNALDFDDLLLRAVFAFRDHPQVLAELQERFQYILIDEYQDTNHAQYMLAHALAAKHRNICVVGDPDQSIYAWRGADIRNILEFERDYPDATVVKLEQNYRSTKTILQIASGLISHNQQRKDKRLWTENEQGEKATVYLCRDEHDEAEVIANRLQEMHEKESVDWNRMAIFYRINALSRVMEDALRKKNLPYVMARGVEFYNRKVIKDVLAYLKVIANPADEVSLTRIVNTPARGIGDASVKIMQNYGITNGLGIWGAMQQVEQITGLSTRAVKAVRLFVNVVNAWRGAA
ncbi:MAG TPA: UvrD-helicase domain-containing protein, partial [Tepidisphaeraceae bacterium]